MVTAARRQAGDTRLHAGVQQHWSVGEKTGTGDDGTAADSGMFWPLNGDGIVVMALITSPTVTRDAQSAAIVDVETAVVAASQS